MLYRPIERTYYREKELWSGEGKGKVVKHEYFILKEKYRGKDVAKRIHERELSAYRSFNFTEIQLYAAWDGLIVWKKLFFEFKTKEDESKVKMYLQKYLREIKGFDAKKISELISGNPFSIPMKYLKDDKVDFVQWIEQIGRRNRGTVLAKMYKEIK